MNVVRLSPAEPIRLALPKGRILKELKPILEAADVYPEAAFEDPETRKLRFSTNVPGFEIVRVRSFDVASFVAFGGADIGIAGRDVVMEFDDPEVKKAVIEIAHSNDYPVDIRKKAIDNLAAFNDPSVVDGLLPMLEEKENYIYYDNIINMVYALGEEKKNAESVRRMAFKAHFSRREHD